MFVAIEGIDGSGKSTVARQLAGAVRSSGRDVILTREPGGTPIGERIRELLLGAGSAGLRPETEALLFAAARAQHVAEVIVPALSRGAVVITDRFTDSTLAYQWGGRGLSKEMILRAQALATAGLEPDLKILLDIPVDQALKRRFAEHDQANRLDRETVEFHERVREAYHALAAAEGHRWRVVDAARPASVVWQDVAEAARAAGLFGAQYCDEVSPVEAG